MTIHSIGLNVDVTQETHLMFYTFYIYGEACSLCSKPWRIVI